MHDGEVVEDKKIRKTSEVVLTEEIVKKRMHFLTLIRFTMRSLFSTPKRLIFLVMMQMLMMIAFTLIFTFRVSVMRDTEITQSARFPNVVETRVLVERKDGTDFTQDDLNYFESIRFVSKVYENGLSFYNSLPLYIFQDDNTYSDGGNIQYYNGSQVAGTDAASTLKSNQIDGQMPVGKYDIVIGHSWRDYQIGETIHIATSRDIFNPDADSFLGVFTITGIDKSKNNILYLSDAFLEDSDIDRYTVNVQKKSELESMAGYWQIPAESLDVIYEIYNNQIDGKRIVFDDRSGADPVYVETKDFEFQTYIYNYTDYSYNQELVTVLVEDVDIYSNTTEKDYGMMGTDLYNILKDHVLQEYEYMYLIENRVVVSLSVKGLNNGVKTVNAIDYETYRTIYPANIPNPGAVIITFMNGLYTGVMMLVVGMLLYSIVHAVTKNVMQSRKKDFAIFRSIGTSKTTLARLVVLEQISIAAIAATLMLTTLYFLGQNVPSIYRIIQYMEFGNYVTLIAFFLFFGGWLGLRFNKRVFKQSVIESIVSSREE